MLPLRRRTCALPCWCSTTSSAPVLLMMYWTGCSRRSAWGSKRLDHRPRLGQCFLVLGGGIRIPDDSRAGVKCRLALVQHDGPNGDVHVHRARRRDVPDGAAVHATRGPFELGDDLHCADLRSEEHTSELQSQSNLVCRLLLEKKKKKKQ